jgi:hypothetical protein
MADASNIYGMTAAEQSSFLAEQRENGFQALSQGQRAFALDFIQSGSIPQASQAAGVKPETGRRWVRDPLVSGFIHYLNQQKEHYSLIDASFVETQYLNLLGKLLGEEQVSMVDKDGMQIERKKFEGAAAVACLRDLAKISGHYKEDGNTINVQVTTLTDEQKRFLDEKLNSAY